jgi:hypothetical protein
MPVCSGHDEQSPPHFMASDVFNTQQAANKFSAPGKKSEISALRMVMLKAGILTLDSQGRDGVRGVAGPVRL